MDPPEDKLKTLHTPNRQRILGEPTLLQERTAAADQVASQEFPGVPEDLARVKSEAEAIKARKAKYFRWKAWKDYQQYRLTSDMFETAAGNPLDPDGDGRVQYAEWTRAKSAGMHAKSGVEPPKEVKAVLKKMKARGFSDCYFFRLIDQDGNGAVTRGEFEQGLKLLKMELNEDEFKSLYAAFDKDGSGRIDYNELQAALGMQDGSGKVKPRFNATAPPQRPVSGPAQFSTPENFYPLLGVTLEPPPVHTLARV